MSPDRPIQLVLKKGLARSIKQGHAWLYSHAIEMPRDLAGKTALIVDRSGRVMASGMFCPKHPIAVRICQTAPPFDLNDQWFLGRLRTAIRLRRNLFDESTTAYRLVNGEGDGLPGLIIDRYDRTAVIKLDGGAPEQFYDPLPIAQWLAQELGLEAVVHRPRGRGAAGRVVVGQLPVDSVQFLENGMRLTANLVAGQKTGFFLDQRDNRALIGQLSRGKEVLNLFSFNGGFSIAAGKGSARTVTSVDISPRAISDCQNLWLTNGLSPEKHQFHTADCFHWLPHAIQEPRRWDLIICDPPSFSPSERSRPAALAAYAQLAYWCSLLIESGGGTLALASCSSHISPADFLLANLRGLGKARRQASLLCERGLPPDHPTPLAMPELRYLKFQLLRVI